MRFPKAFLALVLLFSAPPAFAAAVTAEARAVPSKATIGDEIRLFVRVERPKAYAVEPPSDKLKLAPFELKRVELSPPATGKNRVVETFVLVLTVFETGDLQVPSFAVGYADASGTKGAVRTEPVPVKIAPVAGTLTGKEDIKPIKGPVSMDLAALRATVLGAAAALLLALLVFLVARRRARRVFVDPETLRPPHERAVLEFERLQAKGLLEAGDAKGYYGELGDILRRYFERRFGVAAMDLTTAEIVAKLKEIELSRTVVDRAASVLDTADLAKFAKYVPPRVAGEEARRALLEIVEATKPEEPEKAGRK